MRIRNKLIRILFWSMSICMLVVLFICITGTQHNIVWYKEMGVTAGMIIVFVVLWLFLRKIHFFLEKQEKKVLFLFLILFYAGLYGVSFISRNEPMYDYSVIYQSAFSYAYGGSADWGYLAQWSNNFAIFLWLMLPMKVCSLLSISDPFGVLLAINTGLAVCSAYCVYDILQRCFEDVSLAFMGLLLYVGFLPLWGGTNYFYTDSVSMFFAVGAIWAIIRFKWGVLTGGLAGLFWGIGYELKATTAISMIAFGMVSVFWGCPRQSEGETTGDMMGCRTCGKVGRARQKGAMAGWIMVLLVFAVCLFGMEKIRQVSPSYSHEEEYGAPLTYWLALGIHNNGSYPDNIDFAVQCLNTPGREAKDALARAYIKEHISDLWNLDHYVSKIRYNFASGKMGLSEFNQYPTTLMHELVNDYGKYGGYATMFSSAYFYAIILIGICGSVCRLAGEWKDDLSAVAQLTLFGLFLFLMLWESNNRQLYNHIPWYALYGALGFEAVHGRKKSIIN